MLRDCQDVFNGADNPVLIDVRAPGADRVKEVLWHESASHRCAAHAGADNSPAMITARQNVFGVDRLVSPVKPANAYVENARRNVAPVVDRFPGEIETLNAVIRKLNGH